MHVCWCVHGSMCQMDRKAVAQKQRLPDRKEFSTALPPTTTPAVRPSCSSRLPLMGACCGNRASSHGGGAAGIPAVRFFSSMRYCLCLCVCVCVCARAWECWLAQLHICEVQCICAHLYLDHRRLLLLGGEDERRLAVIAGGKDHRAAAHVQQLTCSS